MTVRAASGMRIVMLATFIVAASSQSLWAQTSDGSAPPPSDDPKVLVQTALEKLDKGEIEEAQRLFTDAKIAKPDLPELLLLEGLLLIEAGRGTEALQRLETFNAAEESRGEYRGRKAVGEIYLYSRMYQQATRPLEQAMQLAPTRDLKTDRPVKAYIAMDLASAYMGLNNHKKAIEVAKEALDSAPKEGDILLRYSEIVAQANDFDLAVSSAEKAVALFKSEIRDEPFSIDAHSKLQRALDVLGRIYQYRREQKPSVGEHYFNLARVTQQQATLEYRIRLLNAYELLGQALACSPDKTEWKLHIASLEIELGGYAAARDRLAGVLARHPNNADAKRMKDFLDKAPAPQILP